MSSDPPRPLVGRHALVTGAGRGIGAAISMELARLGATVSLTGRALGALEEHRAKLPGEHACYVMDVTSEESVAEAIAAATADHGSLAILVNNAGIAASSPFQDGDLALWERTLDVNLLGVVRCIRAALPSMRESPQGRIVNIASTAGLKGYAYVTAYAAAKHAVVGLTRSLALELARTNITVNAVCPGFTNTDLLHESVRNIMETTGRTEQDALARLERFNPQGRLIQPEEVARVVGWLCLPESGSLTGLALPVAGGEVS